MRQETATTAQTVIHRTLKELSVHPAAGLVPASPDGSLHSEMVPLEILADGRILVGRDRFERAVKAKEKRLPTVVVTVPDDGTEMYVLEHALRSHYLSDDQRAALAVEYAKRLSASMRRERARNAAAVRYGKRPSRPTGSNKQDARGQACDRFRIPSKKFRQIRALGSRHPHLYEKVLDGSITLKQARDEVAREQVFAAENLRIDLAPTAALPELILGDARKVLPTLPDAHFSALVTDPPYGVNFRQEWRGKSEVVVSGDKDVEQAIALFRSVLAAAGPKMRREAFLLTFVPAKHEPEFRNVVIDHGWSIIGHPIWVKNTRMLFPHLNIASQHERMLLAIRGDAKLRQPISDVFRHGKTHSSTHPCEKPVELLEKLIDTTTVKGEAVLDPFAGSGSTILAAEGLGRQALGIEIDKRWHAEALQRIEKHRVRERKSRHRANSLISR